MDKRISARTQQKCDTYENWKKVPQFIPLKGEIIIITDIPIPGDLQNTQTEVKIGNGNAYWEDLKTIDSSIESKLQEHINNKEVHINPGERDNWNDKVSLSVDGENLEFY